jgi:hypothetical protein
MDPSRHPPRESFRKLIDGTASPPEARELVRHLLAGCPVCSRVAEQERSRPAAPAAWSYDEVFRRLEQNFTREVQKREEERATAQHLYAELLGHEAVEALLQVQSTRRYASLALCELLLRKSRDLRQEDGAQAHEAAALAGAVAEQLDLGLYGAPVVQDLRALAWAYFANAGRVQAELRSAKSSFGLAAQLLRAVPGDPLGDPLVAASLLDLQASLASYGGRLDEAARLLNRAASLYRREGRRHLLGRTLIKKGAILGNGGLPEAAVRLIRRGIDLIEAPREPRLMVCAVHNLIWFLHESGRRGQAATYVAGARQLYRRAGDRRDLGRLRWLEGKLAPRLQDAETPLREAREELAREGLSYEAALAAMDLAMRYAGERRAAEMRRHAQGMLPLFRSGDMYRETTLALRSFQKRGGDPETAAFLGEMKSYLQRAWEEKNPPGLAPAAGPG